LIAALRSSFIPLSDPVCWRVADKRLDAGWDSFGGGFDELRHLIGVGDHRHLGGEPPIRWAS
jgi:hypothetical protein